MSLLNGPITPMEDASAVSCDAGNPPVRFDAAGAGDGVMDYPKRARSRKRRTQPRGVLHTTAPVPDPTPLAFSCFDNTLRVHHVDEPIQSLRTIEAAES